MSERASVLRRSEHPNQNASPPVEAHFAEEHFPVLRRLFLRGPGMTVQSPQVPADAKSQWRLDSDIRSGAVFCFDDLVCLRRHLQPFDLQMRLTL